MTSPSTGPDPLDENAVTELLRRTSTGYPDLPTGVADRLDSVLAELPELTPPDTTEPAGPSSVRVAWWRRRVAWGGLGTGLAAIVAAGLLVTAPWASAPDSTGNDTVAAGGPEDEYPRSSAPTTEQSKDLSPDGEDPGLESAGYPITYSGHDYQAGELDAAVSPPANSIQSSLDEELDPLLSDPSRRDACLTEVVDRYLGRVTTVDFGSYLATPAMLVVVDRSDTDATTVVAVGSSCDTGIVDELAAESVD